MTRFNELNWHLQPQLHAERSIEKAAKGTRLEWSRDHTCRAQSSPLHRLNLLHKDLVRYVRFSLSEDIGRLAV